MAAYVTFDKVTKIYQMGDIKTTAMENASFTVEKGEFCVIVGPSGAGKTTILNILGGIDRATSGQVTVSRTDITKLNDRKLTDYRRKAIGFVFQFYNLVPNLTALENVELASDICPHPLNPRKVLAAVDLSHRINNFPSQLSGGEQQRVAIARALVKNPRILLCDEPTGALDGETGVQILHLLQQSCLEQGMTVILITHNEAITEIAHKAILVHNAGIEGVYLNTAPRKAEDIIL